MDTTPHTADSDAPRAIASTLAPPPRPRFFDVGRVAFGAFLGLLSALLRRLIGRARNPR